jgi:hypothetical protein
VERKEHSSISLTIDELVLVDLSSKIMQILDEITIYYGAASHYSTGLGALTKCEKGGRIQGLFPPELNYSL